MKERKGWHSFRTKKEAETYHKKIKKSYMTPRIVKITEYNVMVGMKKKKR